MKKTLTILILLIPLIIFDLMLQFAGYLLRIIKEIAKKYDEVTK